MSCDARGGLGLFTSADPATLQLCWLVGYNQRRPHQVRSAKKIHQQLDSFRFAALQRDLEEEPQTTGTDVDGRHRRSDQRRSWYRWTSSAVRRRIQGKSPWILLAN